VVQYLAQAKETLVAFADINGTLPLADTDGDGLGDSASNMGTLPYLDLEITPTDVYKRVLGYQINSNLVTNRSISCDNLRTGLSGNPLLVDADGSSTAFPVAAVLVSGGPTDADADGDIFDDITGSPGGDNTDGLPNYIRAAPTSTFDDLIVFISGNELYGEICEYLELSVNNSPTSGVPAAWVFNQTTGDDLNSSPLTPGDSGLYHIISGTSIELWTEAGGSGGPGTPITASDPRTPIILSGSGETINIL
jgi:hypothetical protein